MPVEALLAVLDDSVLEELRRLAEGRAGVAQLAEVITSHLRSDNRQFDPFDRVLLTKGIDNQILTSFRTLNKSNNVISNTLKVIHKRFQPSAANQNIGKAMQSKKLYNVHPQISDTPAAAS
jgi:hypothetical protein